MANTKGTRMTYRCAFCGKSQDQVQRLIAGPGGVYICDECINLCREIIEEEQSTAKPRKIYDQLNRYQYELFIGKKVRVVTTAALPDQSIEGTLDEITDDAFKLTDSKDRTVFIMRAQVVAIMLASEGSAPGA